MDRGGLVRHLFSRLLFEAQFHTRLNPVKASTQIWPCIEFEEAKR